MFDLIPLVSGLPADMDGLMSFCWSRVTDAQLQEIAAGPWSDNDLAFARLKSFRDDGPPASSDAFDHAPVEALQLQRWTSLDEAKEVDEGRFSLREQHGMRLLSCATLTWCDAHDLWADNSEGPTSLKLAQSAMFLGPAVALEALHFLGWAMQSHAYSSAHLEDLQAVLAVCCLGLFTGALDAAAIARLLDWVESTEEALATEKGVTGPWMLRLSDWHPAHDCLVQMVWALHDGEGLPDAYAAQASRLLALLEPETETTVP